MSDLLQQAVDSGYRRRLYVDSSITDTWYQVPGAWQPITDRTQDRERRRVLCARLNRARSSESIDPEDKERKGARRDRKGGGACPLQTPNNAHYLLADGSNAHYLLMGAIFLPWFYVNSQSFVSQNLQYSFRTLVDIQ